MFTPRAAVYINIIILIKYRVTKTFSKCSLTCRVAIVRDQLTLAAEDPQGNEERTVMILEPSKK